MAKKKQEHSTGRWARNKSDRAKRQEALHKKHKGVSGYQTKTMTSISGKKEKYRVRVDKRGRMYIDDMGKDAPAGYYSDGSRNYKLKRNVRIAADSSEAQKANWYANQPRILGSDMNAAGGYLDHAGRNGMISSLGDGYSEVNFRKTQNARRMMDSAKAYYEGTYSSDRHSKHPRAKSRYIFKIGQDGREA